MCGITGAVELNNSTRFDFTYGSELHSYISSRGPDHYSNFSIDVKNYKVTFGHSRLAIIDLSAASNQPMISEDGRYMLTFNGEIYNYKEIKSELRNRGIYFKTEGDTEVLLKAWETWGQSCLTKFNGMFSFALLDTYSFHLFLIRDRFGVKPLLFTKLDNGQLLFSSSISAIANNIKDKVNLNYCSTGLRYGFFEGNEDLSPFEKVKYVLPGSILKFSLDGSEKEESSFWYSLEEEVNKKVSELSYYDDGEVIEIGQNLFSDAIDLRLRSDVPVALSLSSGVDSSSIASIAKKKLSNLVGFCYGSPSSYKSEGTVVKAFAEEKGIKMHYVYPDYSVKEIGDMLDRTLASQESPFLTLSILAQQEVYKEVSLQGFKVLLGGQGGDEIFAGYRKFFLSALNHALVKKNIKDIFYFLHSFGVLLLNESDNLTLYWNQRNRYSTKFEEKISLISNLPSQPMDLLGNGSLRSRQILDIQRYSIPSLLRYEDRNSMSFGIESRLPLMDYRLVEFAIALQDRLKIKKGFGKWIFREMMKSEVPSYILKNRKKRGFDVTHDWIRKGIGEKIRSNILDNKYKLKDYISDFEHIEKKIQDNVLISHENVLKEAMLLNFLVEPIKSPIVSKSAFSS